MRLIWLSKEGLTVYTSSACDGLWRVAVIVLAVVEGEKLNARRSLYATSRDDIRDRGTARDRGETAVGLVDDHMAIVAKNDVFLIILKCREFGEK